MLYIWYIGDFSMYSPSPHRFKSVCLQSGVWSNKSIPELLSEKDSIAKEFKDTKYELKGLNTDLKDLRKAEVVNRVAEDSKNGPLKIMKEAYPTYFDEESGNTTREGIHELESYLKEEISVCENKKVELKKIMLK